MLEVMFDLIDEMFESDMIFWSIIPFVLSLAVSHFAVKKLNTCLLVSAIAVLVYAVCSFVIWMVDSWLVFYICFFVACFAVAVLLGFIIGIIIKLIKGFKEKK